MSKKAYKGIHFYTPDIAGAAWESKLKFQVW